VNFLQSPAQKTAAFFKKYIKYRKCIQKYIPESSMTTGFSLSECTSCTFFIYLYIIMLYIKYHRKKVQKVHSSPENRNSTGLERMYFFQKKCRKVQEVHERKKKMQY